MRVKTAYIKAYRKEYAAKNRERILLQIRERRKKNPQKFREREAAHRLKRSIPEIREMRVLKSFRYRGLKKLRELLSRMKTARNKALRSSRTGRADQHVREWLKISQQDSHVKRWKVNCETRRKRASQKARGVKNKLSPEAKKRATYRKKMRLRELRESDPAAYAAKKLRINQRARAARKRKDPAKVKAQKKEHRRRYRMRKRNARVGLARPIVQWELAWRTKSVVTCYWCGQRVKSRTCNVDHILALSLGGAHEIANLCISCRPCNERKSNLTLEQWNNHLEQPALL